jgi:hypothetical protein
MDCRPPRGFAVRAAAKAISRGSCSPLCAARGLAPPPTAGHLRPPAPRSPIGPPVTRQAGAACVSVTARCARTDRGGPTAAEALGDRAPTAGATPAPRRARVPDRGRAPAAEQATSVVPAPNWPSLDRIPALRSGPLRELLARLLQGWRTTRSARPAARCWLSSSSRLARRRGSSSRCGCREAPLRLLNCCHVQWCCTARSTTQGPAAA